MCSLDSNQLSAVGTVLTGFAAIVAVFGAFFTMKSQMRKTNKIAWLTSFRTHYVDFCIQVAKVHENSTNDEIYELQKIGLSIRLLLSSKNRKQKELRDEFEAFWNYVKQLKFTNSGFEQRLNSLHVLVEKVIDDVEDRV